MQNYQPDQIAIRMNFQEMPDGRTYVTSPDLMGFHAVIEPEEDFMEAMDGTLRAFIAQYLGTETVTLRGTQAPVSYRASRVGISLSDHRRPEILVAEVA